jgi:hypothetical protein
MTPVVVCRVKAAVAGIGGFPRRMFILEVN